MKGIITQCICIINRFKGYVTKVRRTLNLVQQFSELLVHWFDAQRQASADGPERSEWLVGWKRLLGLTVPLHGCTRISWRSIWPSADPDHYPLTGLFEIYFCPFSGY